MAARLQARFKHGHLTACQLQTWPPDCMPTSNMAARLHGIFKHGRQTACQLQTWPSNSGSGQAVIDLRDVTLSDHVTGFGRWFPLAGRACWVPSSGCRKMVGGSQLENANPLIYQRSGERPVTELEEDEEVNDEDSAVSVEFTPTIPHCSMATLIGLSIKVKLLRSLPDRFKVDVHITPGTHASEHAVNKQLADKERVAAALENSHLLEVVNQCLSARS
ncbi:mitotic spindle-associated MMXD complex subunit MIP18 [Pelobates cultripes]|uniref:Mitotic spindle-associated MMXD complex subunit MIP18 n=1 Tax=Pelobates cultripes TaxID=61616 RepID=A0AAD1RIJ0_PELCU|nr:mitotic spindle-associated MMXD complex subunit MIP18 [Pelobates cultripes]